MITSVNQIAKVLRGAAALPRVELFCTMSKDAATVGSLGERRVIDALIDSGTFAEKASGADDKEGRGIIIFRDGPGSGFMNGQVKTATATPNFSCGRPREGDVSSERASFMSYKADFCDLLIFVVLECSEFFVIPLYDEYDSRPKFRELLDQKHINRSLSEFREIFSAAGMHATTPNDFKNIVVKVFELSKIPAARQGMKRGVATRSAEEEPIEGKDNPCTGKGKHRRRFL